MKSNVFGKSIDGMGGWKAQSKNPLEKQQSWTTE